MAEGCSADLHVAEVEGEEKLMERFGVRAIWSNSERSCGGRWRKRTDRAIWSSATGATRIGDERDDRSFGCRRQEFPWWRRVEEEREKNRAGEDGGCEDGCAGEQSVVCFRFRKGGGGEQFAKIT